ncbi:DUF6174 domain-containing protein [Streptomyces sp. ND04-05B]|uniref:DUF6174 domain-containing protein n=1 Tax=Streptomyces sp. ND04-05B TaxID=3028693 RepID=UPI0029AFF45E|nr:DUF6174 domain-containing protein [Streptomyces sp. ND04-05B]MDX3069004.1 DUF6174 domain-containing protein [Streptomyces sp. ND04-05B]
MSTPATVRLRHRALTAAAMTGALLSTLSACGEEPVEVATPAPSWKEPSAYRYTLTSSEGERALIGTFEVTVRDGKVEKATGLDDSARRAVDRNLSEVPTIAELLKQVEAARRDGADAVDVDYAPNGRPTALSIDWEEDAIDDEEAYTLSGYEALG